MARRDLRILLQWLLGTTSAVAILLPPTALSAAPRSRPVVSGKVGPKKKPKWPKPLVTRDYLEIRLRYERGKLRQRSLRKRRFRKARLIKRVVGRFLAKLYRGKRLMDVVPFNFPLLAPAENYTRTGHRIALKLEANLRTGTRLRLPWVRGINRVIVTDVATRRRWALDLTPLRRARTPRKKK